MHTCLCALFGATNVLNISSICRALRKDGKQSDSDDSGSQSDDTDGSESHLKVSEDLSGEWDDADDAAFQERKRMHDKLEERRRHGAYIGNDSMCMYMFD